jgi:membrane-bound ClpP family serine protease
MENNRDQINEKNNEIITSTEENAQEHSQSTRRLNIEDILRRNAKERKQEKKLSYIVAGIVVVIFIVIALYFFS